MRTVVGVVLLVLLAVGRSSAQTVQVDPQLRAAATLQATVDAASPPLGQVPSFRLALPASAHKQHALGETLLIVGAGAIVVGAVAGGGGGTVLIVGGVACAAYGVYLLQL